MQEIRNLTTYESFKGYLYNVKYYFDWNQSVKIQDIDEVVFILGIRYSPEYDKTKNFQYTNQEVQNAYQNIIWMTYRYNFEPLIPEQYGNQYIYDTGWGCMVRVGQMMMAEAFKRFFFFDYWRNNSMKSEHYQQIIQYFIDKSNHQLSIQNIAKVSYDKMQLQPGQWYNPSDITNCLKNLIEKEETLNNLKMIIFNDNMIEFDEINQKFGKEICQCEIYDEEIYDQELTFKTVNDMTVVQLKENKQQKICNYCEQNKKSILVIVLTRLGLDQVNPNYLKTVSQMFEYPQFSGLLGGRTNMAHYIIGKFKQDFVYLDPHFPQEWIKKNDFQSYFNQSLRTYNMNKVSPSMGITFFLRTPKDAKILKKNLENLYNKDKDSMFLTLFDKLPNFEDQQYMNSRHQINDDSFEII